MMKCRVCGVESAEGVAFCRGCGSSLKQEQPARAPVAQTLQTCPKCSAQARLEAVFCPSCGFRLKTAAPPPPIVGNPVYAQPQYAQPQYAQPQYAQPQHAQPQYAAIPAVAPRKKHKGLFVAVLLVLVIVLGGVGSYFIFGSEIRRMVLGPKTAYALIEAKNLKKDLEKMVDEFAGIGNLAERAATGGYRADLQLRLDEAALGLDAQTAAAIAGITLQERIQVDWVKGRPVYYNTLGLAVGDEKLMTLEIFTEGRTILLGLPDVLAKYVRIDPAALAGSAGAGTVDSSDASMALEAVTLMDLAIDRAELEKSMFHLAEILLEHVDETEYTSGQKLTAGNVSATYDTYTITLTSESAKAMVIDMLKFAREDEALYNLAGRAMALQDGDSYDPVPMSDYQKRIDEAILDIESEKITEPFTLTHTAYVDSADKIVGRELLIKEETGGETTSILYAHPVAGANEAILVKISTDGEETAFLSEYEIANGRKTGSAYASSAGEETFTADFSGLVLSEVDGRQYLLGDISIYMSASSGMPDALDTLEFTGEMDGKDYLVTLAIPGYVEISMDFGYIPAGEVDIPDFSSVSAVDVSDAESIQGLLTEDALQNIMDIVDRLGLPLGGLTLTQ